MLRQNDVFHIIIIREDLIQKTDEILEEVEEEEILVEEVED
jgi:hypothetical protein